MTTRKWTAPFAILVGLLTPVATWAWARHIGGDIVFSRFPDPVVLAFNLVSFLAPATLAHLLLRGERTASSRRLCSALAAGGFLAVLALSVHLQMGYWLSHSSTTALLFVFYLPYVLVALVLGLGVGAIVGAVGAALAARGLAPLASSIDGLLLVAYLALNLHLAHYGRFTLPPELGVKEVPGFAPGEPAVVKRLFYQAPDPLGAITSMELRTCIPDPEAALTITGRSGAAFVTRAGELRSFLRFQRVGGFHVFPVDVEGDGTCEFADEAGGWSPVGLIDDGGRWRWAYGTSMGSRVDGLVDVGHAPQGLIPFRPDADGELVFLVPLLIVEHRETDVVSAAGRLLRKLPYDLQGAVAADLDDDGRDELVSAEWHDGRATFVVRDATLAVARTHAVSARGSLPPVRLVRWPDSRGAWRAVYREGDRLRLLDLASGRSEEYEAPAGSTGCPSALVRLRASAAPYTVWQRPDQGTNTLSIFEPEGRLVYRETLAAGGVVLVLPDEATGEEKLLVTECRPEECGRVWEYSLRSPS
jgi:hypothetical protein